MPGLAEGMDPERALEADGREDVLSSIRRLVAADGGAREQVVSPGSTGVLRLGGPAAPAAGPDGGAAPNDASAMAAPNSRAAALRAAMQGTEGVERGARESWSDPVQAGDGASPDSVGSTRLAEPSFIAADSGALAAPAVDGALMGNVGGVVATPADIAADPAWADLDSAAASGSTDEPAPSAGTSGESEMNAEANPIAALLGDMVREVIRQELQRESGQLAGELRAILLREVSQAIIQAAPRASRPQGLDSIKPTRG